MKNFTLSDLLSTVPGIIASPQEIERYVDRQVSFRIHRLRKAFKLNRAHLEDVQQTFLLEIIASINNFDVQKATWRTFVSAVLNNCYRNQLRQLEAHKRLAIKCTVPLEDLDEDHDMTPGYTMDFITSLDFAEIKASMPPELQEVSDLLMEHPPTDIHRILNIGKATVNRRIKRVRKYFLAAGYKI